MRNTARTYRYAMTRLKEAARRIASLTGRDPDVRDLVNALAVRSVSVSVQTANVEISALRSHVRSASRDPETGCVSWDPEIDPESWMTKAPEDHWTQLQDGMTRSRLEFVESGKSVAQDIEEKTIRSGIAGNLDEVVSWVVGERQAPRKNAEPKKMKAISITLLRAIDMRLSRHDPEIGLQTLGGQMIDFHALARIFIGAIWATGMRPAELWTAVLFAPRPDILMTDEMRTMIRTAPRQAIASEIMMPAEQLPKLPGESLGDAVVTACNQAGAPALLVIRSAKQTNANQDTRNPYRIQILDTKIPREHLEMIAIACQLRHSGASDARKETVRIGVNKVLAEICADMVQLKGQTVTLYAMRHAFATRVKMKGDLAEAAALTGHTSARSVYGYGKLRARGSGSAGWVPEADPAQVDALRRSWGQDRTPSSEPRPDMGGVNGNGMGS